MRQRLPLALLVVMLAAASTEAASLGISPTMLTLRSNGASGSLLLQNRGVQPTRIQVSVVSWSHDAAGEMVLAPTEDLVAYPTLATIQAGDSLRIRVGPLRKTSRPIEGSFRLLIEELPSAAADPGPGVTVRTRLSVPVFLSPLRTATELRLTTPRLFAGSVGVSLMNLGSVHVRYDQVRLRVRDRAGVLRLDEVRPGWYLLAGETRELQLALPRSLCDELGSIQVEVPIGRSVLTEQAASLSCDG